MQPQASVTLLTKVILRTTMKRKITKSSAGGRLQRRAEPSCRGSGELQQNHSVIILHSHSGAMGAGTAPSHAQVTAAVTRARCAEEPRKGSDRNRFTFLSASALACAYMHTRTRCGEWGIGRMSGQNWKELFFFLNVQSWSFWRLVKDTIIWFNQKHNRNVDRL